MTDFEIRVANPRIEEEDIQYVVKALREGRLSSGKYAQEFEKEFAEFCGTRHAVSVNSATAALQLMLAANDIGEGDEVITTPYTFAATANAIVLQNARPVFADIEKESFNIDPAKIQEKITERTKAIMPIHYGGQSSDLAPILEIARKNDLKVFEDAAPAAGATYRGQKVGGIGIAAAFSFFPDKNMTTGEGGMLTTDSEEIASRAQIMRKHGAPSRYYHTEIGWNFKLPDPNAALGHFQLKRLPGIIEEKNRIAGLYSKLIEEGLSGRVSPPVVKPDCTHTFNLYCVRFGSEQDRNLVKNHLESKKIETRICFPTVHLQPVYQKLLCLPEGSYPAAEECSKTTLCLPMYHGLEATHQELIVSHVKEALEGKIG